MAAITKQQWAGPAREHTFTSPRAVTASKTRSPRRNACASSRCSCVAAASSTTASCGRIPTRTWKPDLEASRGQADRHRVQPEACVGFRASVNVNEAHHELRHSIPHRGRAVDARAHADGVLRREPAGSGLELQHSADRLECSMGLVRSNSWLIEPLCGGQPALRLTLRVPHAVLQPIDGQLTSGKLLCPVPRQCVRHGLSDNANDEIVAIFRDACARPRAARAGSSHAAGGRADSSISVRHVPRGRSSDYAVVEPVHVIGVFESDHIS